MTGATAVSHVFAGIPTADFAAATAWYERFFHRPPDGRPHATEAVWGLADGGLVYLVADEKRAGSALVTLIVDDLVAWRARLAGDGLECGEIERLGSGALKATIVDPDGNRISLGNIPGPSA